MQCGAVAVCVVLPGALRIGHIANAIDAIAVVEAIHLNGTPVLGKLRCELNIQEGIALGAAVQCYLEYAPLLDMCYVVIHRHGCFSLCFSGGLRSCGCDLPN